MRGVVYNFFVFEIKGTPAGGSGAQKEDAEADNLVIGADMSVLWGKPAPFLFAFAGIVGRNPKVLRGDKAYVDGFFLEKAKGGTNALKIPMLFQRIIDEHGQWKWFGNQK